VGEGVDDLVPFDPAEYARALLDDPNPNPNPTETEPAATPA
jgi:hypothetical protein